MTPERIAYLKDKLQSWPGEMALTSEDVADLLALLSSHEAAKELLEVADLRGDSELPRPADDPKLWTARMQTAWDELRAALAYKERSGEQPDPPPPAKALKCPECDCDIEGITCPECKNYFAVADGKEE